jgi:uncharacterized membrane protein YfhO
MSQALNDTVSENNIKNTENIENIENTENIESTENAESSENSVAKKKKKIGFHPKRFLKGLQTKLQTSPYLYLLFCFLVPVILMYGIYVVKGIHPFYNGSPLVLDLNAQYVSFFEALRDFALGERSILYSFSRSLGGEFMGMVAYYMASPFTYITVLFPKDRIQEAVLLIMLLKCGLSGASFGFYLHKKSKNPQKLTIFTFALMYALSAYAVVQQHNTMWIDALIWLPLFAYGLENLVYRKKYKLYVLSLSVIMICNYYIGFMICIFAVLYFFYCYFSKTKEEINPYGEKLHFIKTGSRFAIFSLISAAISAFMLIAAYYSLQFGKTEFSSPNWAMEANFDIVDFLTKFLPGSYDTVEPSGLPFVYCGILTLLLLPIYFLAKKIPVREKIASLALISVLILSLILKPLDLVWHGFSMPNWLNSRYSFLLCFMLLIMAYKAFGNIRTTSEKFILGTAAFLILFVAVAQKFEMDSFLTSDKKLSTFGCIWFSIAFTVIIAAVLCTKLSLNHKKHSRAVSGVLAAVICAELFCNGIVCFLHLHKDVAFTTYTSYNNHLAELRPVVGAVKEYDSSFYRMEKVRHRTKNDNMALGMYGITNSTSTLNQKAIDFIGNLGYIGRSHNTMYNGGTAVGDSLLGIKYVIDYDASTKLDNLYERLDFIESEKYAVYENPNALSLAYGVSKDVNDFDLTDYDSYFNRYNGLVSAMLGSEDTVDLFNYVSRVSIRSSSCEETKKLTYNKYVTEGTEGLITISYTAPETGYYYFYAKGSGCDDIKLNFNGRGNVSYLGKDTNHIIIGGYHVEDEPIEIELTVPEDNEFTLYTSQNYLWYFTLEDYNEIFAKLKSNPQFEISESSTEDNLIGMISTQESDQMILTTIPYDKGWKVYVDGEAVETYETLNALMAFDIKEDGEHLLELKYAPTEYTVGIIISIFGISAFLIICAIDFVLKKTLLKNRLRVYERDYFVLDDFDSVDCPDTLEILESNADGDGVAENADLESSESCESDESTEE